MLFITSNSRSYQIAIATYLKNIDDRNYILVTDGRTDMESTANGDVRCSELMFKNLKYLQYYTYMYIVKRLLNTFFKTTIMFLVTKKANNNIYIIYCF